MMVLAWWWEKWGGIEGFKVYFRRQNKYIG